MMQHPFLTFLKGSKEENSPSCLPKILPEFGYAVTNYCQGLEKGTGESCTEIIPGCAKG